MNCTETSDKPAETLGVRIRLPVRSNVSGHRRHRRETRGAEEERGGEDDGVAAGEQDRR